MAFEQVFRVEPAPDGGWLERVEDEDGRSRTLSTFPTRELAVQDAVARAQKVPFSRVVVWRSDAVGETYEAEALKDEPERSGGVRSSVSIKGHPVHPMIVPFVVGTLFTVAITDTIFALGGDAYWAELSFWLIAAGFVFGTLAAAVGLVDFVSLKAARSKVGLAHFLLNLVLFAVVFSNLGLRLVDRMGTIMPAGLALSWVGAAVLLVTGWMGYTLTYKQRIGVFG